MQTLHLPYIGANTKDLLASFNERINTIEILVMWTAVYTLAELQMQHAFQNPKQLLGFAKH